MRFWTDQNLKLEIQTNFTHSFKFGMSRFLISYYLFSFVESTTLFFVGFVIIYLSVFKKARVVRLPSRLKLYQSMFVKCLQSTQTSNIIIIIGRCDRTKTFDIHFNDSCDQRVIFCLVVCARNRIFLLPTQTCIEIELGVEEVVNEHVDFDTFFKFWDSIHLTFQWLHSYLSVILLI